MPSAEIIAIGTELLLGEIQDTNTSYLARKLRDFGIDLFRSTIIGDNPARIAQCINEAMQRAQIIVTTGGLGPTVDDPTRQAVALAFGVELEFSENLWIQIQQKYKSYNRIPTENNRRQAYIPKGAIGIKNPVGTAPGFYYEYEDRIVISLPGVPKEMEYFTTNFVQPYLREKYQLKSIIQVKVIHTAGIGESNIDQLIGDLENMDNPTVGLSAHAGRCDVRVTAKAESLQAANEMIDRVVEIVQQRLGSHIYGYDQDSLEGVINDHLAANHEQIGLIVSNLSEKLFARLTIPSSKFIQIVDQGSAPITDFQPIHEQYQLPLLFQAQLFEREDSRELQVAFSKVGNPVQKSSFSFGGPPQMAESWAINQCLNFVRKNLA